MNIGNIVGAQIGSALIGVFDNNWQWLFVIMACLALVIAGALRIFLVPHPEERGMIVEDEIVTAKIT